MQERTQRKIAIMKECIEEHQSRGDSINAFIKRVDCHPSTADDYYLLVKRGYPSKRITNSGLRREIKRANLDTCYFCGKKVGERHHYDYLNDKKVALCQSCHGKVEWLFKMYSKAIQEKDKQLMEIRKIVGIKRKNAEEK